MKILGGKKVWKCFKYKEIID